jgi:hypothetical protein
MAGLMIGVLAGFHVLVVHGLRAKHGIENFGEVLTKLGFLTDVSSRGQIFDPGYWYITSQEAQFAAWLMEKVGLNMRDNIFFGIVNGLPALWHNPALLMSAGIILGAASMALINNEFKFNVPGPELVVYMKILLAGKANLEELFAELGATRLAGTDRLQANTDRILPGFRTLIKLPTRPDQVVRSLTKTMTMAKSN